jgi:hypothetical protein
MDTAKLVTIGIIAVILIVGIIAIMKLNKKQAVLENQLKNTK